MIKLFTIKEKTASSVCKDPTSHNTISPFVFIQGASKMENTLTGRNVETVRGSYTASEVSKEPLPCV